MKVRSIQAIEGCTAKGCWRNARRAGFTLVEMLAALLVMALMTGIVATGISVSTNVYLKEQFSSQSQVLFDTIENALSDPLRFAQPNAENKPVVVYRNNNRDSRFVSPDLQARPGAKGARQVLYLSGENDTAGVPLLNEGIYGDCTVSDVTMTLEPKDGNKAYRTTVHLTIKSLRDESLTLSHDFTFDSQPGVSKEDALAADTGDEGGGFTPEVQPERQWTDVASRLYGGAGTATESGFEEYSSDVVAADKRELGASVTAAGDALSELSSQRTPEQIAELESVLRDSLSVMIDLDAAQADVNAARDQLDAAVTAFRNAPSSGGGGSDEQDEVYTLVLKGGWYGTKNYDITFRNLSDSKVSSITVELTAHGDVTSIGGNVSGERQQDGTWLVTFNNYGNPIDAHATLGPVYMVVNGTGDFYVE